MTGPEHYREGEQLLKLATDPATIAKSGLPSNGTDEGRARNLIAAHVHLIAASIALTVDAVDAAGTLTIGARDEWLAAIGRPVAGAL